MAIEKIPLKIYFELTEDLDSDLPLPRVTIKLNGVILDEDVELDNPNNETTLWQTDKKISVKEYSIEIDDDVEQEHTITVTKTSNISEVQNSLGIDESQPSGIDQYGAFVKDIEINEISVETLIWGTGTVTAELCPESEFSTNGFITYVKEHSPEMFNEVSIIDGKCIWKSHTNYINYEMDHNEYSFKFATPMYLWLLEQLLQ